MSCEYQFQGEWMTEERLRGIYDSLQSTVSSTASPETLAKIKEFNRRIGVKQETLENLSLSGTPLGVNGVARTLEGIIAVAEGKEDVALTEESMHVVESIIQQTNSKLHNQLMSAIGGYTLYNAVFQEYKDVYKTPEGKPDVIKIKREAIAKLLAEVVIKKAEGLTEKPELLAKSKTWWQSILQFLRGLFQKPGFNPFEKVAGDILEGIFEGDVSNLKNNDEFYQLSDETKALTQELWDKLEKEQQSTLKVIDREKDINEYTHNGVKVEHRVSDVVDAASAKKFGQRRKAEQEKSPLSVWLAEKGTDGHADIESVIIRYTDGEGFLLRDSQGNLSPKKWDGISQLDKISAQGTSPVYKLLENNIVERMKEYPEGTRFRAETTIYDPRKDQAGTIDFLAIYPTSEGIKVDILDWKFKNINIESGKDILTSTMDNYNIQMQEYKKMLQDVYGQNSFGKLRMIPIALSVQPSINGNYSLRGVTIGTVDAKAEEFGPLLPVPSRDESTGNAKIDSLIKKLYDKYDSLVGKKYTPEERVRVNEEMNNIYATIRHIVTRGEFDGLATLIGIYNTEAERVITDVTAFKERMLAKSEEEPFDNKEASSLAERIFNLKVTLLDYSGVDIIFDEPTTEILKVADKARRLLLDLNEADKEAIEIISRERGFGKYTGFGDFMSPQPSTKGIMGSVRPAYRQKFTGGLVFAKIMDEVNQKSESAWRERQQSLEKIEEGIKEWSQGKGAQDYTTLLIKKDSNQLIDKYSREFYDTLKQKIEEKNGEWLRHNIDLGAYSQWAEREQRRLLDEIENNPHIFGRRKEQLIDEVMDATDLSRETAWLSYKNLKEFPTEAWHSKEYGELLKAPQVKALYDFISQLNQEAAEAGYVQHSNARTFLPSLYKSLSEKMLFGGSYQLAASVLRTISLNPDMVGEGMYDPLTQTLLNKVPVYFTRDLGREIEGKEKLDYSHVSRDLLKNISLYSMALSEYVSKTELEGQVKQLQRMEQLKSALPTNIFGKVVGDGEVTDNKKNAKILEYLIEGNFYGHKNIVGDHVDSVIGSPAKAYMKLQQRFSFLPAIDEKLAAEKVSTQRLWEQLSRMQQLRVLGINIGSSLIQFIGGNLQAFVSSGKYWTKTEFFIHGEMKHASHFFTKTPELELELMKEMMPLSDETRLEINKMTSSKLMRHSFSDIMMMMMRKMDEQVQYANYRAMMENAIVIDGKLQNARTYYRNSPEYKERYTNGTLKEMEKEFETKVAELKEEYGLLKQASLDEHGKLKLPIPITDKSVIEYRGLIRHIGANMAGNIVKGHETTARMNAITRSFFMFKNWIPNQMEVRFSELKYNAGIDSYEWGKARTFFKVMSWNVVKATRNINGILQGNAHGLETLQKLYLSKKEAYEKNTGQKLNMDSAAFYDMVRENVKSELLELLTAGVLLGILLSVKGMAPDKDEDALVKGYYNFSLRNIDKINDELFFYYNPLSFQQMLNGSMFPALSVISDFSRMWYNTGEELFGIATDNEKMQKNAHPLKYAFKTFPVSRQLLEYASLANPEIAKSMGVHFNTNFAIK